MAGLISRLGDGTLTREAFNAKVSRRSFITYGGLMLVATACGVTTTSPRASAGGGPSGSAAPPGATAMLRYGKAGDITDFNPWDLAGAEYEVYNQVFSRLVWRDSEGNEHLDLAESYELAPDGMSVTIKVRSGVKWHDGADFTAEDYVTMYGYLSDPALTEDSNVSEMAGLLGVITAVEAPDPTTLVIRSSVPIPYVADLLDYWHAIRIDNPTDYGFVETPPVGTGPFKLTAVTPGERVTFEPNPDYYVDGQPALGGFEISLYGGASNIVQNLQSGGVNGLLVANPAEIESIRDDSAYRVEVVPTGAVTNLYINVRKPPFDNPEVRQALSYSMNRAAMVEAAGFDLEQPVSTPFYNPSSLAYRDDLVLAHPFDLDRARALLDSAGVSDLRIVYPAPSNFPEAETYGLIWQADLATIGVELQIEPVDEGRWSEIGTAQFPDETDLVFWFNARGNRDPQIFWSTQSNYGGTGETIWGYLNQELIDLVAEGAAEVDPEQRTDIYQRTNQMLLDSSHILHISTRSQIWAWAAAVQDVNVDLIGALVLAGARIEG